MNVPDGICLDPGGTLYFSESNGNRVRRLQLRGGDPTVANNWQVTFMAGDNTQLNGAASNTNGPGVNARFSGPGGLAADRAGNVYIADYNNNLVRKMTVDGTVSTLAGSGSYT